MREMSKAPIFDPESFLGFLPFGFIGLSAISLLVFVSVAIFGGDNRLKLSFLAALLSIIILGSALYIRHVELTAAASGPLSPLICTTNDGRVGRVKITTRIFNDQSGSSHGYVQEFFVSPGDYGISINNIADIEENSSGFREKHWGATWECVA